LSIETIVHKLQESRLNESDVGAFYMVGDNLLSNSVKLSDGDEYGGFINYSSHWDLWKALCRSYPKLKNYEYDDFPRGRVVFDKTSRKSIIYLDKKLNNPQAVDKICKEYHLGSNYEVNDEDEHYQSTRLGHTLKLTEDVILRGDLRQYVDCDVQYREGD